jgi:hypoxanthine phosphoribosyltransferase
MIYVLGRTAVDAADAGDPIHLDGHEAALLAVLALSPRREMKPERLYDIIVPDDEPGRDPPTRGVIQKKIEQLASRVKRKTGLGLGNGRRGAACAYRLKVDDEDVDILEVERMVHEGRQKLERHHPKEALERLNHANDLTPDSPRLSGLDGTRWDPDGGEFGETDAHERCRELMIELHVLRSRAAKAAGAPVIAVRSRRAAEDLIRDSLDHPRIEGFVADLVRTVAQSEGTPAALRNLAKWQVRLEKHFAGEVESLRELAEDLRANRAVPPAFDDSEQDYYLWEEVGELFESMLKSFGDWRPDVVVGINRGGLMVGGVVAKRFGLPGISVIRILGGTAEGDLPLAAERLPEPEPARRVLLADEAYRSGIHAWIALRELEKRFPDADIKYAVLVEGKIKETAPVARKRRPDFVGGTNRTATFVLPWDPPDSEDEARSTSLESRTAATTVR